MHVLQPAGLDEHSPATPQPVGQRFALPPGLQPVGAQVASHAHELSHMTGPAQLLGPMQSTWQLPAGPELPSGQVTPNAQL
jgi:hypothetical protein